MAAYATFEGRGLVRRPESDRAAIYGKGGEPTDGVRRKGKSVPPLT